MYSLLQGFESLASLDAIHVIPLEKVFPFDRRADIHNKQFLGPMMFGAGGIIIDTSAT